MKQFLAVLPTLAPILLLPVAAWIARHLKIPSDLQRATLLSHIANEIAAWAVTAYPGRALPELVRIVVTTLTGMSGLPTKNAQAIERAATAAVTTAMKPAQNGAGAR